MKGALFLLVSLVLIKPSVGQDMSFDILSSNIGPNKSIIWNTSAYGSGFGHKIYNSDGAGVTYLRIAGRDNSATWKNIVSISSEGKIGIGTLNPLTKFHFVDAAVGSANADSRTAVSFEIGRQKLELKAVRTANDEDWSNTTLKLQASIDVTNHQSLDFVNDHNKHEHIDILTGNQAFNTRFTYDGKVGIGTKDPQSKLAVNGKITSKEVQVNSNGWPDFVFEEGYDLPALSEVEVHIQKNKHLPDIPSAKEVEKNGINLGEMDAKLLQKIEELTLYMIEQNKKIEQLSTEIEYLKSKYNEK